MFNLRVGAHSRTSLPCAVPSRGARKTSPAGRLLKEPLFVIIPESTIASLPFFDMVRWVPFVVCISMFSLLFIIRAIFFDLSAIFFQFTFIGPLSIDLSNSGMLA